MDSLVAAAARALMAGDPLAALNHIALRDDPPALALRGIALAQLDDFEKARRLLARAERSFEKSEIVARARCVVASAEVSLLARDLANADRGLEQAAAVLEQHGDLANAAFARLVAVRRMALVGDLTAAKRGLLRLDMNTLPARLMAVAHLVTAEIGLRELRITAAREAFERARAAADAARMAPLLVEIDRALRSFEDPAARVLRETGEHTLRLAEVEALFGSGALVVDACRREIRRRRVVVPLVSRPVLFALALALAEPAALATPSGATRETLIARAFGATRPNDSHRARLRVELGRLRKLLEGLAEVRATRDGFEWVPAPGKGVVVLLPPAPGEASAVLALLSGGDPWSSSGLAAALGKSQRSLQRALAELEHAGRIQALGRGRTRRWVTAERPAFATTLLLVARGALG